MTDDKFYGASSENGFRQTTLSESGAMQDHNLSVKQKKCSRVNASQQLKRLCRTFMPDISSTDASVAVTNYKCYKKKRHENIGVTNDDDQRRSEEDYRDKKEVVVSLLFTMSSTTSHHHHHSGNGVVSTRTWSNVDEVSKETEELRSVTSYSHGSISLIGGRREMEDALSVKLDFLTNYDFFGVYDGHGGSRVAHACRDLFHNFLMEVILEEDGKLEEVNWGKVMTTSFCKMDEEVNKINGAEVATIGSTAVVAVVGKEEVIVANCGDSRAVLSRGGVALALSNDHKVLVQKIGILFFFLFSLLMDNYRVTTSEIFSRSNLFSCTMQKGN